MHSPVKKEWQSESDSDTSDIAIGGGNSGSRGADVLSAIAESDDDDSESDVGVNNEDHAVVGMGLGTVGDETVLKSGYLWKKGGKRRKTWKKRWFVLRPHYISLYKSTAEYQLLRLIDLAQIHSVTPVKLRRRENAFCLVCSGEGGRTFYLQADGEEQCKEWIRAVQGAQRGGVAIGGEHSQQQQQPQEDTLASQPHPLSASPAKSISSLHSQALRSSPQQPKSQLHPNSPPAKDPSLPILQGYLMKCGSKRKIWRKRWFVLTSSVLSYYHSHMDHKPQRTIALDQVLDALEVDLPASKAMLKEASSGSGSGGIGGGSGNSTSMSGAGAPSSPKSSTFPPVADAGGDDVGSSQNTFKIICTKRSLLLCAPEEEEEVKWVGAIRALLARRVSSLKDKESA